jgi:CheY-like chemotaxis protein
MDMAGKRDQGRGCEGVLIVEDDEDISDTLKFALELEHYQVTTAANGAEALAVLARQREPCLILLDLMMPVMNGWELARALQDSETLRRIPIALVTAYYDETEVVAAKAVIRKPIELDVLLGVVKRLAPLEPPAAHVV